MKFLSALLFTILLSSNLAFAIYNPQIGRRLTRDPIQESGGLNMYAYCGNNPINHTDKLGLDDLVELPPNYQIATETPSPTGYFTLAAHGDKGEAGSKY